jgi:hypothetical protein
MVSSSSSSSSNIAVAHTVLACCNSTHVHLCELPRTISTVAAAALYEHMDEHCQYDGVGHVRCF